MLGDGVWLRFAVKQHGFRRCQIDFAGDVVLDVVEVCHPVAFKHGKAVLKNCLVATPPKTIARISPTGKFYRPYRLNHRSNVDRSCREACQ